MKIANIVPTEYLHLLSKDDYGMALAHLVKDESPYTKFYAQKASEGAYIILDNGVIETGKPLTIERLLFCAEMIGAQEIILPDVFLDCDATLDSTHYALEIARQKRPDLKLMGVPQGKTIEEWVSCALLMLEFDIDTIGIPKVLTSIGGRDARLEVLMTLGNLLRGLDIHLLGCWSSPLEVATIHAASLRGVIKPVRGVDSALPYVYARSGLFINEAERPEGHIDFNDYKTYEKDILKNLDIWKKTIEGPKRQKEPNNIINFF